MNALGVLLAGLPRAGEAGDAAQLLARLAKTSSPEVVSLRLRAGGGRVRVRVAAVSADCAFRERRPGAYARDLAQLDALADRWGHERRSSGHTVWWAQLGDAPRIGGEL